VDDFRQKGVIGAFRDAALDAADLAKGAVAGVQGYVAGDEEERMAVVRSATVPARGATVPLELPDGNVVQAVVVDIDGVSDPPRARVVVDGEAEAQLVLVLPPGVDIPASADMGGSFLDGLKQEWNATVQEFREKGALGAMKDATLDAVDLFGNAAVTVGSGVGEAAKAFSSSAASYASPLIDLNTPAAEGSAEGSAVAQPWLLDTMRNEVSATMQDFREKGAVGALKDATWDAVDLVSGAAQSVGSGAVNFAKPLIDLDSPIQRGTEGAAAGAAWLKEGWTSTVQDFRERGAAGTMKDATTDAAGFVTNAAQGAVDGARSLAARSGAPTLDFFSQGTTEESSATVPAVSGAAAAVAAGATAAAASASSSSSPSAAPRAFAPPAREPAKAAAEPARAAKPESPKTEPEAAKQPEEKPQSPVSPSDSNSPKAAAQSEAAGTESKPPRKSLVEMRRNQFEKPKESAKKDAEEEMLD